MKRRILVTVATILAFTLAGSLSPVRANPQQESQPHKGQLQKTSPNPTENKVQNPGSELGELESMAVQEHMTVIAQVDSMMQQMTTLRQRAQSYSKSFGVLAEGHHGADKSEILMMQRMSDSMGVMAGEIKVSLQQYKDLLEDETTSESGSTKAEVLNLKGILDGIARQVDGAVNTLQRLEQRLGQG
jgi:hypothetical protein